MIRRRATAIRGVPEPLPCSRTSLSGDLSGSPETGNPRVSRWTTTFTAARATIAHSTSCSGFDHSRIVANTESGKIPKLNGISGGGVWRVHPREQRAGLRPRLVGIVLEHPARLKKSILAIRIELLLMAIRHQFPELTTEIPPSPRLSTRVT